MDLQEGLDVINEVVDESADVIGLESFVEGLSAEQQHHFGYLLGYMVHLAYLKGKHGKSTEAISA